ncbi:MAG: hypothetical protein C6W57_12145 [Caldibacillus debilis]|nr:MAG: hypothetical protein C6W57_12145 [Caldibacillus debilis]
MKIRPAASDGDGWMQTVDKRSANAFAGQPAGTAGGSGIPGTGGRFPVFRGRRTRDPDPVEKGRPPA